MDSNHAMDILAPNYIFASSFFAGFPHTISILPLHRRNRYEARHLSF